jgi:hypothetical protein
VDMLYLRWIFVVVVVKWCTLIYATLFSLPPPPTDEGRFKDDYMEGQGTMKMNENVIIATYKEDAADDDANKEEVMEKNDWMIPLQFQSDISHIHQKAGFTQVGL